MCGLDPFSRQVVAEGNLAERDPGVVEDRRRTDTAGPLVEVLVIGVSGHRCDEALLYGAGIGHTTQIHAILVGSTICEDAFGDDTVVAGGVVVVTVQESETAMGGISAGQRIPEATRFGTILIIGGSHQA